MPAQRARGNSRSPIERDHGSVTLRLSFIPVLIRAGDGGPVSLSRLDLQGSDGQEALGLETHFWTMESPARYAQIEKASG
jgi:hypothetical protein